MYRIIIFYLSAALTLILYGHQETYEVKTEEIIGSERQMSDATVGTINYIPVLTESQWEEIELLSILVEAEAGNQDFEGKQLVADVVMNRVASERFPDTVQEVIFSPGQFQVIDNGSFEKCRNRVSESSLEAAMREYESERINEGVLYFARGKDNGTGFFKHGDHWFSY